MKITVHVTDNEIRKGKPGDRCECALAKGVRKAVRKRGFKKAVVAVSYRGIAVAACGQGSKVVRIPMTPWLRTYAEDLDFGIRRLPVDFEIDL